MRYWSAIGLFGLALVLAQFWEMLGPGRPSSDVPEEERVEICKIIQASLSDYVQSADKASNILLYPHSTLFADPDGQLLVESDEDFGRRFSGYDLQPCLGDIVARSQRLNWRTRESEANAVFALEILESTSYPYRVDCLFLLWPELDDRHGTATLRRGELCNRIPEEGWEHLVMVRDPGRQWRVSARLRSHHLE